MRRNQLWVSIIFGAMLTGCGPNIVKLVYVGDEQKVILHPDKGTVLQWTDSKGNPVPVTFGFGSPCRTPDEPAGGKCTIDVDAARVPYDCKDCADPEIIVGSGISILSTQQAAPLATPPTATVYMACNGNQVSIYHTEVTISQKILAAGASTLWAPGGLPTPIGADWKVDNFSSAICTNSPPFNKDNNRCNLNPSLSAGSTTYTVSSAMCNNTSTTGKVTITP
jgi:hypothetical protein